jgi:hypothetical protein
MRRPAPEAHSSVPPAMGQAVGQQPIDRVIRCLRALATLALIPAVPMACVSPMMGDAPGASDNSITIALMLGHMFLPITLATFSGRGGPVAAAVTGAHLLFLAALWTALASLCDGQFSCSGAS